MVTTAIVLITCLVSYLALTRHGLINKLSHHPFSESRGGQYHRLLTAGFVHGSWGHLFINMFVLFQFGKIVESLFGQMFGPGLSTLMFVFFYVSAIVVANLGTFFKYKDDQGFSSVGASGVTTAIVFIYALFDPWQMFLFPPVPAIVFAVLYVIYSQWASKNSSDNIDHQAHMYGGLYGIVFLLITFPDSLSIFLNRLQDGFPF